MKNRKFVAENIKWDTDGEEVNLPKSVEITFIGGCEDEIEEMISDYLSDEYGYCHLGFTYTEI